MEEEIYERLIRHSAKPYFPSLISIKDHIIFLKYSSIKYRPHILSQYKYLCDKILSKEDRREIYYLCILYNDLILFNCGNEPIIMNLNLLIFCCFYLSIKERKSQGESLKIKTIKKLFPDKFNDLTNQQIRESEVLCLKLLNYRLDYMTAYDIIVLHIKKKNYFRENIIHPINQKLIDLSVECLNKILESNDIRDYIFQSPLKLSQDIYYSAKKKINEQLRYIKLKEGKNSTNENINNTSSTNNSSIIKNNSAKDLPTFKKINPNSKKAVFIEPIYSISSISNKSNRINRKYINNKNPNIINPQTRHCKRTSEINTMSKVYGNFHIQLNNEKITRYVINMNEIQKRRERNKNSLLYSEDRHFEQMLTGGRGNARRLLHNSNC